jgi:hypothetical protein
MCVAEVIEQAQADGRRIMRNLPEAHAPWQGFWRHARFRRAFSSLVDLIYRVDVSAFADEQFDLLLEVVEVAVKILDVHVSRLGVGLHDVVDREYFRETRRRLLVARDGFQQGLPADPAKRPSPDELMDVLAAVLAQRPLSQPDHTTRTPVSTP